MKKILIIAPSHYIEELKAYYIAPSEIEVTIEYYQEELLSGEDLRMATERLVLQGYDGFVGLVDWSSLFAAYLNKLIGNRHTPAVSVVAALQDKLCSRKLQAKHVGYKGLALDSKYANQIKASEFPLFIKPRRAAMSFMAQELKSPEELSDYCSIENQILLNEKNEEWRKLYEIIGIGDELTSGIDSFVVESLLPHGLQVTLDGFVQSKKVKFFGFTKSVFLPNHISFKRFDYPYHFPRRLVRKIERHAQKFVKKSGFNNSLFNIEYKIDIESRTFALVEINTRPSSQFMYSISTITGVHPLDAALYIVSGNKFRRRLKPIGRTMASVCVFRQSSDAIVKKIPTQADLRWFYDRYPTGKWKAYALPGEKLSDHPNDSHTYRYAEMTVFHQSDKPIHDFEDSLKHSFDKVVLLKDL